MNTRKTRLTLLGLAFGILLALLIVPQTRWLVRLQTLTVLHLYHPLPCNSYTTSPTNDARLYNTVTERSPDDFQIQYANAISDGTGEDLPRLKALTHQFPNEPALYANILRYEVRTLHSKRSEGYALEGTPVPSYVSERPMSSLEKLADYEKEAAAGERIDPENAYFPFMRSYGLLAARRDAEALAAVQIASVKPVWNEYLTENVEAQWRLHTKVFGDPGALPRSAILSSELLPQYSVLRETARIVAYQAVLKEQAGHREDGLALREALRRCGDIMRVQSTTLIGSLVGIAISSISETRPGGGPLPKYIPGTTPEQMAQKRLEIYCAYVTKIGHPEAARRARDEELARRSVQALDKPFIDSSGPIVHLAFWWLVDIGLLLNIGWLLLLGIVAAGRARWQSATKPPIGWKAALLQVVLTAALWVMLVLLYVLIGDCWVMLASHVKFEWHEIFGLLGILGLFTWFVVKALRRLSFTQRWAILRTAALIPVLASLLYGIYWVVVWAAGPLAELPQGFRMLTGGSINSDTEQALQVQTVRLCATASLVMPLLLAVVLSLNALVRQVPIGRSLVSGFYRFSLPLACLLVVVYGGLLLGTARQERTVSDFSQHIVYEENHYLAAQAGRAWPGPVD